MSKFDETFDWVVVGSGAGSMSSALVMRQAGKSVVILEKTDKVGGTTAKSGGVMWMPNNRFMHEEGEEESAEKAMTYLDAVQEEGREAPGTSRARRQAYVDTAPKMVEFLLDQGIPLTRGHRNWPDYYDDLPGGCSTTRTVVTPPFNRKELGANESKLRKGFAEFNVSLADAMEAGHLRTNPNAKKGLAKIALRTVRDKLMGRKFTTAGAALMGRLYKRVLEAGADVRTESPVMEVLIEDGRAVGVLTVKDGKDWRIGANLGVLVNAGGFAQNQEMRDKYLPGTQAAWSQTPEGDTGDMHRELDSKGAVLGQMDQMVGYQSTQAPGWEEMYVHPGAQNLTGKPHAILVDQSGKRFMNEGGSYELYCETMVRRNEEVPAIPSWAIVDAQYVRLYQLGGKHVDKKIPKGWIESGYLHKADTLAELAKSIGVDAKALEETVERWNGFVRKGRDEDFHRGEREYDKCGYVGDPFSEAKALGTIEEGPFYSVPVVPGDVSTYGGVLIDERGRVLKESGEPFEGLYACGTTTASIMGNVYPGAGASVGPSITFGYIAARNAAGLDNQP